MKYKYDGQTYVGSRKEIIESLKHDLENNKQLMFIFHKDEKIFCLGEEKYLLLRHCTFNVNFIKKHLIIRALEKVPENSFKYKYNHKIYYGSKEKILEKIEKDLRKDFMLRDGIFHVGGETHSPLRGLFPVDLILLCNQLIARALKKIENEIY